MSALIEKTALALGAEYGKFMTEIIARSDEGPAKVVALVRTRKEVGVLKDEQRIVECPDGHAYARLFVAAPELLEAAREVQCEPTPAALARLSAAIDACGGVP